MQRILTFVSQRNVTCWIDEYPTAVCAINRTIATGYGVIGDVVALACSVANVHQMRGYQYFIVVAVYIVQMWMKSSRCVILEVILVDQVAMVVLIIAGFNHENHPRPVSTADVAH